MILQFDLFAPYSDRLVHGITTRQFGSFNGSEIGYGDQLKKLEEATGLRPAFPIQIHSDSILKIVDSPKVRPEADAFVTQSKNVPIGVKSADCQGILFFDPVRNAIAATHSGWRGSAQNIIGKTVERMKSEFGTDPNDLVVGIGPSIGPCCLEFTDPEKELPAHLHPYVKGRNLDFWSLSLDQLKGAGVKNIEIKAVCTKCNPDRFYSHRNKDTGRMALFIGLK
ncbi:peptidoglycan editing factor PgeF [Candidatus Peregrinibacteria bacterium]|nr:peptidoglycan editing factor PgeF [Candidatus Peregrinibacteria bacterium]